MIIPPGYDYIALQTRSKLPLHAGWNTAPSLTLDDVTRILRQGGNYGVRLGRNDLVVDIDPRNGGSVEALERLCACDISAFPIVDTPSGGHHVYMRLPADTRIKSSIDQLPGIDFKHYGGYVVGPGSIHPNGGTYELSLFGASFPASDVPQTLLAQITVPLSGTSHISATWTPDELASVLHRLDPRTVSNHDTWFALMCACHEATGGLAENEFVEWSVQDELYSEDGPIIRQRWQSLTAGSSSNAGAGTLLHLLAKHGVTDLGLEASEFAAFASTYTPKEKQPTVRPIDDMNARFHVVQEDGKLRILELRQSDELGTKHWIRHTKQDFLDICESIYHYPPVEVHGTNAKGEATTKLVPMAKRWIENDVPGKRCYPGGVVFMPEVADERANESLNLWRGFAFEPMQGDWSLLQDLILSVLCAGDRQSYEYVLNWLARAVQFPHLPAGTACVFKGLKGTGKGTLGRAFVKLFGAHGMPISSPSQVTGRFNSHLQDCVALFADEAFYAGDKAGESVLKALITEPRLMYEAKGLTPKQGRNCTHILMASNADWVVPAGLDGERRFACFETTDEIRSSKWFAELNEQMNNGGHAAMLYDLMHRDISKFLVHAVPNTRALVDQKLESMDPLEQWFFQLIDGDTWKDSTLPIVDEQPTGTTILCQDFQTDYVKFTNNRRPNFNIEIAIGILLRKFVPDLRIARISKPAHRMDVATDRPRAYILPELSVVKRRFSCAFGQNVFEI